MAVDVCSETSGTGISPRYSFSRDIDSTSGVNVQDHGGGSESDLSLVDFDFNFCFVSNGFPQEFSSADELFSDGRILPIDIKSKAGSERPEFTRSKCQKKGCESRVNAETKLLKEFLSMSLDDDGDDDNEKSALKSFWKFKRSNSDSMQSKGIIRSLHFLSRSKSTGSAPSPPKQAIRFPKETPKPSLRKQPSLPTKRSLSASNAGAFYHYCSSQKPPQLRKCGSYGNAVKFNPVLNIPSPCVSSGTVSLFGSLLCSRNSKKKKI